MRTFGIQIISFIDDLQYPNFPPGLNSAFILPAPIYPSTKSSTGLILTSIERRESIFLGWFVCV